MTLSTVGVSLGHRELHEADHWILSLDPAPVLACTHLAREPFAHVAISLTGSGTYETAPALSSGASAALSGQSGRAVIYPGWDKLVGTITVGDVVSRSAIDRVEVLGGEPFADSDILDTQDFVRPQFRNGELVLTIVPAVGGVLRPFEVPNPTPCCAIH
ncbi:hypothetical protein [Actinoplanes sp. TBRC 11911]|uniref:hypothetical protein n=1 Tax=Actinoplanes sp. TBRC 11911 TaxID=2729386 RepID=UPI0028A28830|nr:hypothetical protein [Actinoplanes sp. TBRC 11911]